ncbi:restriction endonuclease subunit S [Staphylococcus pseudintermedius]|uniref:restriction endonuclease subunit S n=1 Tax=Staphylococcus pseudintermedius TaxID=283734 RepID=UPI002884D825|nr:restriction endonuclease subunit S [Staphylococcus pseudintermedius]MDT0959997.1 restriction endonuclease subunit S [Staphylococcus pseudintermedius]HAR6174339.1 restriction endonuclease subunit S [Staphylococcus pseudintermedius]
MTDLKRNVPDLRFPEFEGEWEEKKLGEFVDFGKGKLLGKKDLSEGGKYPCILYGELYTKYGAIINSIQSRTNVNPDKLKKAEKNQVLIPSSGETVEDIATASAIDVNEDVYIGGDLNILTPKKDDGKFISLSLNSVNKWNVSRFAQGKTVVHLYNNDLKKLKVNLPIQFEEQQKIGDFFSKLDRQIELEEQKLVLLEEQKKGYMQKIFSQELRFKDDNGNDYPEWEEKKLSDLGSYSKSYSFSRDVEGEGKVHHIHYGDIHSKLPSKISDINLLPTIKESKDFEFLQKGDIIFADASEDYKDLGKAIMVDIDEDNIIAGLHTHVFRPNLQVVSEFLMYYTKTLNYFKFIKRQGTGISVLGISKKNLSNFILGLPEYKEQQKIGDFFSKLDQQIELQGQKIENLKQRKKGLLQKMFV